MYPTLVHRTFPARQPWIVLVDGLQRVIAVFDAAMPRFWQRPQAGSDAVSEYFVDACLTPPPAPGTVINPQSLCWVEMQKEEPAAPIPAGPSAASQVFIIVDDDE